MTPSASLLKSKYTSNPTCISSLSIEKPLMKVVSCRHADCAAYLLEQGADAFAVDKAHRRSAIHYAVLGPRPDALRMLVSDDAKIHTEDSRMPLRDVRVHDMSGQCRWRPIVHIDPKEWHELFMYVLSTRVHSRSSSGLLSEPFWMHPVRSMLLERHATLCRHYHTLVRHCAA